MWRTRIRAVLLGPLDITTIAASALLTPRRFTRIIALLREGKITRLRWRTRIVALRLSPRLIARVPPAARPGLVQVFHALRSIIVCTGAVSCPCEEGCREEAKHGWLTFGAANQAAGPPILINGAAPPPHHTSRASTDPSKRDTPRAGAHGVIRGLRDESGGVSECFTGCAANRTKKRHGRAHVARPVVGGERGVTPNPK